VGTACLKLTDAAIEFKLTKFLHLISDFNSKHMAADLLAVLSQLTETIRERSSFQINRPEKPQTTIRNRLIDMTKLIIAFPILLSGCASLYPFLAPTEMRQKTYTVETKKSKDTNFDKLSVWAAKAGGKIRLSDCASGTVDLEPTWIVLC
jgi:uncharacterized protein YceK